MLRIVCSGERTVGYYHSDNAGSSWIRVSNNGPGFASAAATMMDGDRAFMVVVGSFYSFVCCLRR